MALTIHKKMAQTCELLGNGPHVFKSHVSLHYNVLKKKSQTVIDLSCGFTGTSHERQGVSSRRQLQYVKWFLLTNNR